MTLENILSNLINHLQITIRDLNDDVVAKELGATLHDPQQLPHKEISSLAANAVDLLGDIDILLEPGHTILADHFLGDWQWIPLLLGGYLHSHPLAL